MLRIFKTRAFQRWMRKTELTHSALIRAVQEMERGLIDADLGGGIFKKRIALPGRGKRGSVRTLVASNRGERWFFLIGFRKNERENVSRYELQVLRENASDFLNFSIIELEQLIRTGDLEEIGYEN